jgi:hypothetical protein
VLRQTHFAHLRAKALEGLFVFPKRTLQRKHTNL